MVKFLHGPGLLGRLFGVLLLLALPACATLPRPSGGLTPAQIQVLRQEGFQEADEGWVFSMPDKLLFASDESGLLPDQRQTIDRIARALLSVDIRGARVEGHTDATGSETHNDRLSRQRAEAVAAAMAEAGMKADALKITGLGARYPVADNRSAGGRLENRRVAIIVSAD